MRRVVGCGLASVLAIVLVITVVGWLLSTLDVSNPTRTLQPVPQDVPPAAGAAVPDININESGRTSLKLAFWADPIAEKTGIPSDALKAYGNAALIAQESWPSCHVTWNTLAGIGHVETRHGTYSGKLFGGSKIDANGFIDPPIIGVQLNGSPGFAEIKDTDHGALDGDSEFDRAVGPMQFIPGSWGIYGRDADGDGTANPNQIDDAALSAANLLCAHNRDLSTPAGWTEAIRSYNSSSEYLVNVRNAAASYALEQPAG